MTDMPGENSRLTKIHSECMDAINDRLIVLQDETIKPYVEIIQIQQRELKTLRELEDAVERSGLDICFCKMCSKKVVVIPDGLPICDPCAEKESKR